MATVTHADETDLQRLRWRCRRGMRELDAAMLAWLDNHYLSASADERERFVELLNKEDPELFGLLCGKITEDRYADLLSEIGLSLRAKH